VVGGVVDGGVGRPPSRCWKTPAGRSRCPPVLLCCGLTWISTGQLATAKKVLRCTVDALTQHVQAGQFIVGLEPSCTSVFRPDAADLLGGDDRVARIAEHTVTLAELLTGHTPGGRPPRMEGIHAIAQVHCHQHAVLGWAADQQLLDDAGALAQPLATGCCGLAGNFGFEPGHLDVSTACAESVLLPAVRSAAPDTVILADGFSCRTQTTNWTPQAGKLFTWPNYCTEPPPSDFWLRALTWRQATGQRCQDPPPALPPSVLPLLQLQRS